MVKYFDDIVVRAKVGETGLEKIVINQDNFSVHELLDSFWEELRSKEWVDENNIAKIPFKVVYGSYNENGREYFIFRGIYTGHFQN